MLIRYLSTEELKGLKPTWGRLTSAIEEACQCLSKRDFSQPIKPYVHFKEPFNRIIAMPAYLGGEFDVSGIKWIASFPGNLKKGLSRANAITVLNASDTGMPMTICSSTILSAYRTAAVSGFIAKKFMEAYPDRPIKLGITGFGLIGQFHAEMFQELVGERLQSIHVFDSLSREPETPLPDIQFTKTWEEAYNEADIFITCTTSPERYINTFPKQDSLLLNVSLRDCEPSIIAKSDLLIVDSWDEVCRENTDVEQAALHYGLTREDTISIEHFANGNPFLSWKTHPSFATKFASFHPMGMAIFDIAITSLFSDLASRNNSGTLLPL